MKKTILFTILTASILIACNKTPNKVPENIDHLVYTAPTLEQGMDEIEALLGISPVIGGRHPNYGTHNALLSLGPSTYLEIIAPDPALQAPEKGRLLEKSYNKPPQLTTWVLRSESIEELQANAIKNGLSLGAVEAGQREKPDGTVLSWKLSDPYAFPYEGAIPFLISWGDTPHPATVVPRAGELVSLVIAHPDPQTVRSHLETLGVTIEVRKADQMKLTAEIRTADNKIVSLQ